MFKVSNALDERAKAAAVKMIADKKDVAPIETKEGRAMLHISTDKTRIKTAFMTVDVDGTTVYVGLLA